MSLTTYAPIGVYILLLLILLLLFHVLAFLSILLWDLREMEIQLAMRSRHHHNKLRVVIRKR
jgi:succinate dehydrogenase/fumarate reductase cytochrome b subunit